MEHQSSGFMCPGREAEMGLAVARIRREAMGKGVRGVVDRGEGGGAASATGLLCTWVRSWGFLPIVVEKLKEFSEEEHQSLIVY